MKKVLVTGAAGTIGLQVIKYLLSEGKYEITAIDLKTKQNIRRLRGYKKRVNIVYADVYDKSLVENLVKTHDYIIYLAGISPVYVNYKPDLGRVDYEEVVMFVNALKKNEKCFFIYASSTSVYEMKSFDDVVKVTSNTTQDKFDNYSKYKLMCEKYISSKCNNYSIFRLGYVLVDPRVKSSFYSLNTKSLIEAINIHDAAYSFVSALSYTDKINGKVFNVTGGNEYRIKYADYLYKVLCTYGLSFKYVLTCLFAEKNYTSLYCEDSDKLENIIHYRNKSINIYFNSLEKYSSDIKRLIPRILALPFRAYVKHIQKKR